MSTLNVMLTEDGAELKCFSDTPNDRLVFKFELEKLPEDSAHLCDCLPEAPSQPKQTEHPFAPIESGELCFVRIKNASRAVMDSKAKFDISQLPDGVLRPELVICGVSTPLPPVEKQGELIRPQAISPEHLYRLAQGRRILKARISELEKAVRGLCSKVYGEPLFIFPSDQWRGMSK